MADSIIPIASFGDESPLDPAYFWSKRTTITLSYQYIYSTHETIYTTFDTNSIGIGTGPYFMTSDVLIMINSTSLVPPSGGLTVGDIGLTLAADGGTRNDDKWYIRLYSYNDRYASPIIEPPTIFTWGARRSPSRFCTIFPYTGSATNDFSITLVIDITFIDKY